MLQNTEAAPEKRRARGRPKSGDLADLEARLIRVARRGFIANGYGATSMNEIAGAARVSKGTLYARFPSKADLFRAIIDAQISRTGVVTRPIRPRPKTLEAMLRRFAERALRFSLAPEIIALNRLIHGEAERFPELGQAVRARSRAGIDHISRAISDYAAIDGIPCRDPDAAAEMFITLIRGFYADVTQRARPASFAEIKGWTPRMLKLFLAGRPHW